eukprot:3101298-Pyramimonas_sp.AAC.1
MCGNDGIVTADATVPGTATPFAVLECNARTCVRSFPFQSPPSGSVATRTFAKAKITFGCCAERGP